jgi:acetate kinase
MAEGRPAVLVINAGSSSLRAAVFGAIGGRAEATARPPLARVHFEERPTRPLFERALEELRSVAEGVEEGIEIVAVAHRVVHGGPHRAEPAVIDAAVLAEIESLVPLAPLHQPHNLAGIRAAIACLPTALQVACFDTAFHRTCPTTAQRFAIPTRLHDRGIRRYGFHGLSYASIRSQLPAVVGGMPRRVIAAHLGAGASLCGLLDGRSVATTMGFTPLDGLVMATRCGSLDPGVVIHLVAEGMDAATLTRLLYHESGLLGVSGSTGDMRTLLASDDPRAREAVDLFCHRAVREIGSMAAALGGVDAIVFTAGIGERAPAVRRRIAAEFGWLGLSLDMEANAAATGGGPARISTAESKVMVWVIPTQEERTMLGYTLDVLAQSAA